MFRSLPRLFALALISLASALISLASAANAQTLASMKQDAGLINVARGGVCDEPAVIAALQSGRIRCAHLDVFEKEPLPAGSPLWDMPNLILTPHNASASSGNDRRSAEMFLLNLEKWARGEALVNPHTA